MDVTRPSTIAPRPFTTVSSSSGANYIQQARARLRPVSIASGQSTLSDTGSSTSSDTTTSRDSADTVRASEGPRDTSMPQLRRQPASPRAKAVQQMRQHGTSQEIREEDEDGDCEGVNDDDVTEREIRGASANEPEQGLGFEGYVLALHDFTPSNPDCLSFRMNQVIKVHNRDPSGWWDGEFDGERGWFPSNYVDDSGLGASLTDTDDDVSPHNDPLAYHCTLQNQQQALNANGQSSAGPQESLNPALAGSGSTALGNGESHSSMEAKCQSLEILEPIQHSIALLQNAVRASRWAHFQPATACVISSVRSVLSETDCLTRESATLRRFPALTKERKQVLSELSRLVTQSRRASASEDKERPPEEEMEAMLRYALNVLANTRNFLAAAASCGAKIPTTKRVSSSPSLQERVIDQRSEFDKTPTPSSPGSSYLTATQQFLQSETSSAAEAALRQAHSSTPLLETLASVNSDPVVVRRRPYVARRERRDSGSSVTSEGSSSGDVAETVDRSLDSEVSSDGQIATQSHTREEVIDRACRAHDHLVSIIAAFVGHLHTHTRDSPAASYVFLVDLTREVVIAVTNLLVILEGVQGNPVLVKQSARQMVALGQARDTLYEGTSALVTASRAALSRGVQGSDAGVSPTAMTESEIEKRKLLGSATKLVTTSQLCLTAIKQCLMGAEATLSLVLSPPSKAEAQREAKAEARRREEDEERHERTAQGRLTNGVRSKILAPSTAESPVPKPPQRGHSYSLSVLDRKASSLNSLRQLYGIDSTLASDPAHYAAGVSYSREDGEKTITSDEGYEETEHYPQGLHVKRPSLSQRRGLTAPYALVTDSTETRLRSLADDGDINVAKLPLVSAPAELSAISSGAASDSGDDMSRQYSRTSHSTIDSSSNLSGYTTDTTSASLSSNRRQSDASVISEDGQSSFHIRAVAPTRDVNEATLRQRSQNDKDLTVAAATIQGKPMADVFFLAPDYEPEDICFNADGQVTGGTLAALVERLTPHASMAPPEYVTPFFLCFRIFASPEKLFEALVKRYNLPTPSAILPAPELLAHWTTRKLLPIRARVINVFRIWLELHWQPTADRCILAELISFLRTSTTSSLALSVQRVLELANRRLDCKDGKMTVLTAGVHRGAGCLKRVVSVEKLNGSLADSGFVDIKSMYLSSTFPKGIIPYPPAPIVSKSLLTALKLGGPVSSLNVLDINPLELARQLTIMESKVFCCILPEELIGQQDLIKKPGHQSAKHVKQMSALTTQITGWIAECILDEADTKKRTQLVKYFIKLGDRCVSLNNFNALFAIQSALNASTIGRLRRTWDGLSTKYRSMMETQSSLIEHTRNFSVYRARLRAATAPALPFVGLFLTDITFCHQGNAACRPSPLDKSKQLINFDKFVKKAKIVQDLQRFQVPFNLIEVSEIQAALTHVLSGAGKDSRTAGPEELYKRSLFLEPRKDGGASGTVGHLSLGGKNASGLDIFNWK